MQCSTSRNRVYSQTSAKQQTSRTSVTMTSHFHKIPKGFRDFKRLHHSDNISGFKTSKNFKTLFDICHKYLNLFSLSVLFVVYPMYSRKTKKLSRRYVKRYSSQYMSVCDCVLITGNTMMYAKYFRFNFIKFEFHNDCIMKKRLQVS
jgi:hypothetical protein